MQHLDALERHAQLAGHHLRERRLITLTVWCLRGEDGDVSGGLYPDRSDLPSTAKAKSSTEIWSTGGWFDESGQTKARQAPLSAQALLLLTEARQVRQFEGTFE